MKELYLIRHGEAAFGAATDFERELTQYGQQQIDQTARALLAHLSNAEHLTTVLWASPLIRAQQSAEILSSTLGCPCETKAYITPDDNPTEALINIHQETNADRLFIVTHMPFVADLAATLTNDRSFQSGFNTAECQFFKCTDYLPGCGTFISRISAS